MVLNVDNILSNPKISRTQLSQVYAELKKLNLGIKWIDVLRKNTRKDVISTYKQATQQKIKKTYTIDYILYNKFDKDSKRKPKRTINLKGVKYEQWGKPQQLITTNEYFIKKFKFDDNGIGDRNNIIDGRDKRYEKTRKHIAKSIHGSGKSQEERNGALHMLSYMDAIYIYQD